MEIIIDFLKTKSLLIRYGKKLKNYMIVICMKNKIKRGEIKMGKKKKTSRFYIEYGKSKKCSDCKYDTCEYFKEAWNFPSKFKRLRHLIYCLKCSFSSNKNGFVHHSKL